MSAGEEWCLERIKDGTLKIEDGRVLLFHRSHKRWIVKKVSYREDTCGGRGYLKFGDRRLKVYLHRLVWMFSHNSLPSENIAVDHRDGDKFNNDPFNLKTMTKCDSDSQGGNKSMDLRFEALGRWFEFVGKYGREPYYNEEILFVETGF